MIFEEIFKGRLSALLTVKTRRLIRKESTKLFLQVVPMRQALSRKLEVADSPMSISPLYDKPVTGKIISVTIKKKFRSILLNIEPKKMTGIDKRIFSIDQANSNNTNHLREGYN